MPLTRRDYDARPRMRRLLFLRLMTILLGLAGALLVSEIVIRLIYPDRVFHATALAGHDFEVSDVPGVAYHYRRDLPGLTTAQGLVGTRDVELPKPPGRLRILSIADSVGTMAADAPRDPTLLYPARLEAALRRTGRDVEVLNM